MLRRPPRSTRTATLFPYTTLFRSAWLRLAQTGARLDDLDISSAPRIAIRMLDHWDNLDRSVERGYAGQSIWDWWRLPDYRDPRYTDYARANASKIGRAPV